MTSDTLTWMPVLAQTVTRALMDGAFVLCFEVDDTGPLEEAFVVASVRLCAEGLPPLVTELQFPQGFARQLALDTIGETDPAALSVQDVVDTVLELANVVAGGLARAVVPEGQMCRIEAPVASSLAPRASHALGLVTDSGVRLRVLLGQEVA